MVLFGIPVLSVAIGCACALAQTPRVSTAPDSGNVAEAAPSPASDDLGQAILEWTPPALSQLSGQAVAKESFTLDRTMLAAAAGLMPDSDADLRQTVAKLDGVSVHVLRFAADGQADPSEVEAVREAYHLRGWKHVLSLDKSWGGAGRSDITDVWLVLDGTRRARREVVLVESPKSLDAGDGGRKSKPSQTCSTSQAFTSEFRGSIATAPAASLDRSKLDLPNLTCAARW